MNPILADSLLSVIADLLIDLHSACSIAAYGLVHGVLFTTRFFLDSLGAVQVPWSSRIAADGKKKSSSTAARLRVALVAVNEELSQVFLAVEAQHAFEHALLDIAAAADCLLEFHTTGIKPWLRGMQPVFSMAWSAMNPISRLESTIPTMSDSLGSSKRSMAHQDGRAMLVAESLGRHVVVTVHGPSA